MKNIRTITLLFIANSVSGFAQGITMLAIPWYFINTLSKGNTFGIIYAVVTIIGLFWGLLTGVLIDKYDRRKIMLFTNLAGGVLLLTISVTGFSMGIVPVFLTGFVFAITFFIFTIHYPNLYSFAQEITDPKDYGRITSYLEIQGQTTSAIAGAIAMVLFIGVESGMVDLFGFQFHMPFAIKKWELHQIFLLDGITYFASFILIFFMQYVSIADRKKETGTIIERLSGGVAFLKKNSVLFIFGNASYSVFVFILVAHFFLFPSYIKDVLGAEASVYAGSEIFFSIGAIGSGIFIRWIFKRWTTVASIIVLMTLTTASMFIFMFNEMVFIYYLLIFFLGLSNAGTRIMRITYLFNRIPNYIIGRTTSVFQVINVLFRLIFISLFTLPFFTRDLNIIYSFMIFGVFLLISSLTLIIYYRKLTS